MTRLSLIVLALLTASPAMAWTVPPVTWDNYWYYGGRPSIDGFMYRLYRYELCKETPKPKLVFPHLKITCEF